MQKKTYPKKNPTSSNEYQIIIIIPNGVVKFVLFCLAKKK